MSRKRAADDWDVGRHIDKPRKYRKTLTVDPVPDSTDGQNVFFGARDARGRLHGDVIRAADGGAMIMEHYVHGTPMGIFSTLKRCNTLRIGTSTHEVYITFVQEDGTVELRGDNNQREIKLGRDGTKTVRIKGKLVERTRPNGIVEQGDTVGGQATITYPDPQEKKGDEPWVIREQGEFKQGKLVEGIRTKRDNRGVVYRYTAKGTLLKDPEDAALGQKLQALTEMIDKQAEEIEQLREQLKQTK